MSRSRPTPSLPTALTALIALLLALPLAAAQPLQATDDLGRLVELAAPPQRIVSLAPSHSESVCVIVGCERLVGVDTNTDFPAALDAAPRVGNAFTPDIEAIVALEPDLVLADEYSGVHEALERLGVTVYAGTPQTVAQTLDYFTAMGELLGDPVRAAELIAEIREEFEAAAELVAGSDPVSVFIELDPTPYSAGPGSFIGELVAMAGGENIVTATMGDFPQVSPEFVVAGDPQYILLTDAPFGESAATVAARPGWSGLQAVVENRVLELSVEQVNLVTRPGPRLGEALWALVGLLHPELQLPERP